MRLVVRFLSVVSILIVLNTCRKDSDVNLTQDIPLDEADANYLAGVKDTIIHIEDIILDNGMDVRTYLETYDPDFTKGDGVKKSKEEDRPLYQKFTFISRMFLNGEFLVTDENHTYGEDGVDGPKQTGLAYSYGSKIYDRRLVPPAGGCRNLRIYGLDCSGMMRVLTLKSGLDFPALTEFSVAAFSSTNAWDKAFKASADFKDLKMKDMGWLVEGELENGDIVIWNKHMGIYLYGFLYQSNGSSESPDCEQNLNPDKGPRLISFSEIIRWRGFQNNYKVFRVDSGDDYTMTAKMDISGFPNTPEGAAICKLGSYIEEALINFTIKEGEVFMNYINNIDPPLIYLSGTNCTCISMSFSSKSMIDFTNFTGFVDGNGDLNFNIIYTLRYPKTIANCGGLSSDIITPESISYTETAAGKIGIPTENQPVKETIVPIWLGGKVKLTRDL